MMTINLIAVGKLKESYLRQAQDEYTKRLGAFCKLNIIEIDEEKLSQNYSQAHIDAVIEEEGKRILQKVPQGSTVIPLCIEGRQISSEELSDSLESMAVSGVSNISLVIGGSHGLSQAVKNAGKLKLSMSKMTFPHQLARIMLLEQVYRAFSISAGTKYHK